MSCVLAFESKGIQSPPLSFFLSFSNKKEQELCPHILLANDEI